MHTIARDEIVAQHVADMHRQAAKQRLVRELRARRKPNLTPRLRNTVCGRQRHGGPAHVGEAPAL